MPAERERYVPAAGRAWLTGSYDRTVALTMREPAWRPALVAAVVAGVPPGGTAVEAGCGTGALTIAMAGACAGARIVGVDGDPEILELARAKPGAESVEWHERLASELPLDTGEADAALTSLLLHHLTDDAKRAALRELARVLAPGAALHIADWGPPRGPVTAAGARALQLFDGAAGPRTLLAGGLPGLLTATGFGVPRRRAALRTVWGTLEIWRAARTPR